MKPAEATVYVDAPSAPEVHAQVSRWAEARSLKLLAFRVEPAIEWDGYRVAVDLEYEPREVDYSAPRDLADWLPWPASPDFVLNKNSEPV